MIAIRKSKERGFADHGWLKSFHTFSFASYHDPKFMGFRSLRVINEDRIEGGKGFGKHPHRDMEIISYVVSGSLQHEDTMGNKTFIHPGEVQMMSAGTGVFHSEMNAETDSTTHFFQIWIMPKSEGGAPGYGQKSFEEEIEKGGKVLVVSEDGRDGSIAIKQDARIYISRLGAKASIEHRLEAGRGAWIHMVAGSASITERDGSPGVEIQTGDAVRIEDVASFNVLAKENSELMLFDLR